MNEKGILLKEAVLTTNTSETIASYVVPDDVDRVLVAISNEYSGGATPTVSFSIYAQFAYDGAWWEVDNFDMNGVQSTSPVPLPPGRCFWGLLPDVGVSGVKILASKTGGEAVPVGVEVKYMAADACP